MKVKDLKIVKKLAAMIPKRPQKKLRATARAARQTMEDYDAEEPTTKLSSAFIVVLILHVVAVGGIYAFNSIKASRRDHDLSTRAPETASPAAGKPAAPVEPAAPANANNIVAANTTHRPDPATPAPANRGPIPRQYEVKPNDTLNKIAFAYKTSTTEIMAANQLKEGATLKPGQLLIIPAAKTTPKLTTAGANTPSAAGGPATASSTPASTPKQQADVPPTRTTPGLYTVKKGDTLTSIAKSFGVSVDELEKANKTTDPKKLQLGQVLKVPPRKS